MKGDFTPGKTISVRFNTHKADGTPITLAGTPAVSVYKSGSTTESTVGVTLTVDYDSRTGLHNVVVDTSADGTFYSAGSDFDLVLTAGTVDSVSVVGAVVGSFSLSNRAALRPTTADRTLDVSAGGEAGLDWANIGSPTTTVNLSGTTVATLTNLPAITTDWLTAAGVSAGAVTKIQNGLATAAQMASLSVNTRANISVPVEIENPDTTQLYRIHLYLHDVDGNMEVPDSTPTITLANVAGTDRSSRLSAASNPGNGAYYWDYTATNGDTEEQLVWLFTVVEGGITRVYPATSYVVEETAYRFSSSDRSKLEAIHTKLPSKSYLTGTTNSDGDVQLDEATGTLGPTQFALSTSLRPLNYGTLQSATGGYNATLEAGASALDNAYVRCWFVTTGGTAANQCAMIEGYNGTTKEVLLHQAIIPQPDNTTTYVIIPAASVYGVHQTVQADVVSMQANVITDTALAASAVTEIQNGLATAASLATLAAKFVGITLLADWLRRAFRKDTGTAGMATAEAEIQTGGTATYVGTTDNLEAIKDAGGGGGGGGEVTGFTEEALDQISAELAAASITVVSPLIDSDTVEFIKGDDYYTDEGRQLTFTEAGNSWPVLTSAEVVLTIGKNGTRLYDVDGTVVTATGSSKQIRFNVSNTNTSGLSRGCYGFSTQATLSNGHIVTLTHGTLEVTDVDYLPESE